jgi:hypothetical protein
MTMTVLSTVVPFFSTRLPAYRPPPFERLPTVYQWLAEQPEPMIVYELPLPRIGPGSSLGFVWGAVHHKKRLVHGYSSYIPLTDTTLRGEWFGLDNADFWRTLGVLGATHLIVHTKQLAALPGGISALARLSHHAVWRVASFSDAEVYRVPAVEAGPAKSDDLTGQQPMLATGARVSDAVGRCVEIGPGAPLIAYVPESTTIAGLRFLTGTPFGDMDDAFQVDRSADLQSWRPAPHQPLMSTSLAEYLRKPTPALWTHAALPREAGPFVRVTSRGPGSFSLCELSVDASSMRAIEPVAPQLLHIETNPGNPLTPLALDGDSATRWISGTVQAGGEWLQIDLGAPREIVAVVLELGSARFDYGRELALDCGDGPESLRHGRRFDGRAELFERPFLAQVLPLAPPRRCRTLRVRQTGRATENGWSVAELHVYERRAPLGSAQPTNQLELPVTLDVSSENVTCTGCWPVEDTDDGTYAWTTATAYLTVRGLAPGRAYRVSLGIIDPGGASRVTFRAGGDRAEDVATQPGPVACPTPLTASADGALHWSVQAPTWRPRDRTPGSTDDRQLGVAIGDIRIEEVP